MALVIDNPTLGILNLQAEQARLLVAADVAAVERYFSETLPSTKAVPRSTVLFLYATIEADGHVAGTELTMGRILAESTAKIVVVASEVPRQSLKKGVFGERITADLVITLNRKGDKFPTFFAKIFERMSTGLSLPLAWVQIFPQVPGSPAAADAPDTVFVMGPAQVTFAPRLPRP